MKRITVIAIAAAIIGGISCAGTVSVNDAKAQRVNYCDMVQKYKTTHGEQGWPDFNHNFNKLCKK